jgi:hypothetical protein
MVDDRPTGGDGRPLRQPAAAADAWQSWRTWAEATNRALQAKANSAEVDTTIRAVVKNAADAIRELSEAIARERDERARLAQAVGTLFDGVEARLAKMEFGRRAGAPSLTDAEQSLMKARLRQALSVSLDELAEQRLAATTAPAVAANERVANMPRLTGEALGTVLPPTPPTTA